MPTLIIIAPTYAIAEQLTAAREYPDEWHWFTSQAAADRWLLRCQERGIVIDPEWIRYAGDDAPQRTRWPAIAPPRKKRRAPNRLLPSRIDLLREGQG
jgi:hypothetical protein